MKFNVEVTETLSRILTVEAPTYEQAEAKIQEMYENCDIVLKADDIVEQRVNLFDDDVPDDHPVDVIVCRHSDTMDSLYRAVCSDCGKENND